MMTMDSEKDIKAAARDWLLRLSLESPTPAERAQFAAWCAEDPRRAAAYHRFESIWQQAATLEELKPLVALPLVPDTWWRRVRASLQIHPMRWAASASLAAASIAFSVWYLLAPVYYATGVAEVREIHLTDGSEITLGARSSLEVAFRLHERRVALTSGLAFFSVSKNPSRPFIVLVADKEVRVVGTKFEVRRDPAGVRVSVVEGTVEVMQVPERASEISREAPRTVRLAAKVTQPASATIPDGAAIGPNALTPTENPEERVLTAGQQVTAAPAGAIPDPQAMPPGEPAAWRHGRLVYVDATLRDIIADANRYSREPIVIADEGVANLRVSVTYPSDRIEEMVAALSRSLPLEIEHPASGGIVLKPKERSD
jgi:transmembrane sensor